MTTRSRSRSVRLVLLGLLLVTGAWWLIVPMFQDCLHCCGPRQMAGQDLEIIKKAISLHDAREAAPLGGTDLTPLLGRYMQEIPRDGWGRDYLFDRDLGVLASLGADGLPGGEGEDRDIAIAIAHPGLCSHGFMDATLSELFEKRVQAGKARWPRAAAGWMAR